MGFIKHRVCEHCGSSKCKGKEFKVHLKYNHYEKVDHNIIVCQSQVRKKQDHDFVDEYLRAKDGENYKEEGCHSWNSFDLLNYAKTKGLEKIPEKFYYNEIIAHGIKRDFEAVPIGKSIELIEADDSIGIDPDSYTDFGIE